MLALRLWIGEKLYGSVGLYETRVSSTKMIKFGHETEAEALRYIAANTTIPVPRLYKVHQWKDRVALELEYFPDCETLQSSWEHYSSQQKQAIVDEIAGFIKQLRKLESPHPQRISSTNGNACRVIRVGSVKRFGPFDDAAAFHSCVRSGMPLEDLGSKVADIHQRTYTVKFTHGDLGVQNILVRDAKVVAIIDWECAGWYPEYWEYSSAHYNHVYLPEFYEMLRGAEGVERYDEELGAERVLWRTLDQPLDAKES